MGYSSYSDDFYANRRKVQADAGKSAFDYSARVDRGEARREVHAMMNPSGVTRESRDSEQHPESNAIAVLFDVTGSMRDIPFKLQGVLPKLMNTLLQGNLIPHPQVLFGAIGDATSDAAPFQIGQYESGVEMDQSFEYMFLEGNGGGQSKESYELALYFMARCTALDCYEKRGKKGYLFVVADEETYPEVDRRQVESLFGQSGLEANIPVADIVREVMEKFELYVLYPMTSYYAMAAPRIRSGWEELVGPDRVLLLQDPESVVEAVALKIAEAEGISLSAAQEALLAHGSTPQHISQGLQALRQTKTSTGSDTPSSSHVRL